jgi:hypothetical protein
MSLATVAAGSVFPNRRFENILAMSGSSGIGLNRRMAGPKENAIAPMETPSP